MYLSNREIELLFYCYNAFQCLYLEKLSYIRKKFYGKQGKFVFDFDRIVTMQFFRRVNFATEIFDYNFLVYIKYK